MQNPSHINSFAEGWTNINTNDHRTKDYTAYEVRVWLLQKVQRIGTEGTLPIQFHDRKICAIWIQFPRAITNEAGRRREGKRAKNQEKYWHGGHKLKLLAKWRGTELEMLEKSLTGKEHLVKLDCPTSNTWKWQHLGQEFITAIQSSHKRCIQSLVQKAYFLIYD